MFLLNECMRACTFVMRRRKGRGQILMFLRAHGGRGRGRAEILAKKLRDAQSTGEGLGSVKDCWAFLEVKLGTF